MKEKKLPTIKKLNIQLIYPDGELKDKYKKDRAEYIASYQEYKPGGFLSMGGMVNKPDIGEAKWNARYPNGFDDWVNHQNDTLSSVGQQRVIDKINEIIDYLESEQ